MIRARKRARFLTTPTLHGSEFTRASVCVQYLKMDGKRAQRLLYGVTKGGILLQI